MLRVIDDVEQRVVQAEANAACIMKLLDKVCKNANSYRKKISQEDLSDEKKMIFWFCRFLHWIKECLFFLLLLFLRVYYFAALLWTFLIVLS